MDIAITGATGLIGSALAPALVAAGHRPIGLTRGTPTGDQIAWDPATGSIDAASLEGIGAVIHLAGAGIGDHRWTDAYKREIHDSRSVGTALLANALAKLNRPPTVLLSGSAIGIYGDRGDQQLTESSAVGARGETEAAFLASLCQDWEAEALAAEKLGIRVVLVRIGLVQTARGGALAKLLLPFQAGAGGPVGSGKQWQSWIASEDLLGIMHHAMWDETLRGPVNAIAPNPVTSAEYGHVLGKVLHRPSILPAPTLALKALFGELATGAILASQKVASEQLPAHGFSFLYPTLEEALRFTLGRSET